MMNQTRRLLGFDGKALLRLLEVQLGLYRQLHALAEGQRKLVAKEDSQALLKVLGARQRLVNELTRIHGHLAPVRKQWEEIKESMSWAERERGGELLSAVRKELAWIIASDREDTEVLSSRRVETARAMGSLRSAGDALSAYQSVEMGAGTQSRYVDLVDQP